MLQMCRDVSPLVGRLLIGGMFLWAGVQKAMAYEGTVQFVGSVFPMPEVGAIVAIVIEIGAGLALILGWRTRFAADILAVFLVVVSVAYHSNFADQLQMTLFLKNMAILGGLLAFSSFGSGKYALDA